MRRQAKKCIHNGNVKHSAASGHLEDQQADGMKISEPGRINRTIDMR